MPRKSAPRRFIRRAAAVKRRRVRQARSNKLATVRLVKKMIHRNMENKLAGTQYGVQFNAQINSAGDAYGLLPSISNGTGDNARVGNRINPRGLLVTVQVYITDTSLIPPSTVFLPRILVLQQKSQTGYQPGLSVDFSKLLDHGQGEGSFTGDLMSYRSPINTDCFHVYQDIKTKLCLGNGNGDENPNIISKVFKFWVPCPKTLLYGDAQQYPQNFAPFITMGYATGQNVVTPPESTFVTMDWTSTLYYEDA